MQSSLRIAEFRRRLSTFRRLEPEGLKTQDAFRLSGGGQLFLRYDDRRLI